IKGRYYMYRYSANNTGSEGDTFIKSILYIGVTESNGDFCDFLHKHPDRNFERGARLDTPIRTHGLVFYLSNNFYLIGNTEQGKAINFIALREPINKDFNIMLGYTLTSNADRVLIAGRVVVIKDQTASENFIKRDYLTNFDEAAEKFSLSVLGDPD